MKEIHFDTIDSTSTYLKRNRGELPSLTAVSASFQSLGKGRMGRSWKANEGENLLFSVLLKDEIQLRTAGFLSLVAAVTVAKAIEEELGLQDVSIKWPNDVYVFGRKVCGILLEGNVEEYLIIGIGINVNQTEFEGDYRVPPTSLRLCANREIDLPCFKSRLYAELENNLKRCQDKEYFLSFYSSHDFLRGKSVFYEGKRYTVLGVDDDFLLILGNFEGKRKVLSNEVTLALE